MKTKKMRIVIHQPRLSYYLGGGEIVPIEQARFLSKLGHKIIILTRKYYPESPAFKALRKEKNKGIKIVLLDLGKKTNNLLTDEPGKNWERWNLESIIFGQKAKIFYSDNLNKIDLIITHLTTDSIFLPSGPKNILHIHGEPSKIDSFIRLGLLRPDAFCSVSKNVRAFWKKEIGDKPAKLIHNGVDISKFHSDNAIKKDIDILFVGRFIENKGIADILNAVKNLKDKKIVFVGNGPLIELIMKKKRKGFEIHNNVSERKLLNLYQRAKIFICPSTSKEGVLTTMLEAAACGCAIITTNCCGMKDFARNNINSIVVKPNNSKQLRIAIKKLINNQELRSRLGKRAERDILEYWTWPRQIKKFEIFYKKVLQEK